MKNSNRERCSKCQTKLKTVSEKERNTCANCYFDEVGGQCHDGKE